MAKIEIVDYDDRYIEDLAEISYQWLKGHKLIEPIDERMLNHPREEVVDKGGFIFFIKYDDKTVGTVSLLKEEDYFIVAKLGVLEGYKGLKLGRMLMEKCIVFAREKGAKKLVLDTNHQLTAAIALYKKLGFVEIPYVETKYAEADMMMKLEL